MAPYGSNDAYISLYDLLWSYTTYTAFRIWYLSTVTGVTTTLSNYHNKYKKGKMTHITPQAKNGRGWWGNISSLTVVVTSKFKWKVDWNRNIISLRGCFDLFEFWPSSKWLKTTHNVTPPLLILTIREEYPHFSSISLIYFCQKISHIYLTIAPILFVWRIMLLIFMKY